MQFTWKGYRTPGLGWELQVLEIAPRQMTFVFWAACMQRYAKHCVAYVLKPYTEPPACRDKAWGHDEVMPASGRIKAPSVCGHGF